MSTSYTSKSLIALREAQEHAFKKATPGSWFDEVSDYIQLLADDEPVLTLGLQNGKHLGFDKEGNVIQSYSSRVEIDDDGVETSVVKSEGQAAYPWRGFNLEVSSKFTPGCAPCIAEVDNVRYAAGVVVVAGKGNTGKTPFVHALGIHVSGEDVPYKVVRFGEPLAGYHASFDDFIADLGNALVTSKVVVIDSMKDVIAAAGGTTTTGGLSRGAFQLMSDIGIIAASRGSMVIVSLNPTSDDMRVIELVNEAVRSNATTLASSSDSGSSWDIITRTGEGLLRVSHVLQSKYEDRIMKVGVNLVKSSKSKVTDASVQNKVTEEELEAALKRMTNY